MNTDTLTSGARTETQEQPAATPEQIEAAVQENPVVEILLHPDTMPVVNIMIENYEKNPGNNPLINFGTVKITQSITIKPGKVGVRFKSGDLKFVGIAGWQNPKPNRHARRAAAAQARRKK